MITVKKVLVAVDLTDTSTRVLEFGRMLADACGASLHLLHVIAPPLATVDVLSRAQGSVCRRLDGLLDRTDREVRRATTCCTVGTPAAEIARHAAEQGMDLIVMGTHSHDRTFQMAGGSIAEAVIGLAPCAVLAVKRAEHVDLGGVRDRAQDSACLGIG